MNSSYTCSLTENKGSAGVGIGANFVAAFDCFNKVGEFGHFNCGFK